MPDASATCATSPSASTITGLPLVTVPSALPTIVLAGNVFNSSAVALNAVPTNWVAWTTPLPFNLVTMLPALVV